MKIEVDKSKEVRNEAEHPENEYSEQPESNNGTKSDSRDESGDQDRDPEERFIFEIDPRVLVESGAEEIFTWLQEKHAVKISKLKQDVTVDCYSMTLQEVFQKKKLRPWQASLAMTAIIGIDFFRQKRNKPEVQIGKIDDED